MRNKEIMEEERQKMIKHEIQYLARMLKIAASYSYVCRINFETLMREYLLWETRLNSVLLPPSDKTDEVEVKDKYSDRQKKIITYLEKNSGAGISEIVAFFGESLSDKTVQRDLNELIERGQIKGSGDRRWRKYALS